MKRTIKFFYHKLGSVYNTEVVLIPTLEYHYYPSGNFIEHGVYGWKYVLEIKFLIWGTGVTYFIDYDEYYDKMIQDIISDEPLEYSRQITSIPEKQIGD
jgi:hypothetical protein